MPPQWPPFAGGPARPVTGGPRPSACSRRTTTVGRLFKYRACGSREVTLFLIDDQVELDTVPRTLPQADQPARWAPMNYRERDPKAYLP